MDFCYFKNGKSLELDIKDLVFRYYADKNENMWYRDIIFFISPVLRYIYESRFMQCIWFFIVSSIMKINLKTDKVYK